MKKIFFLFFGVFLAVAGLNAQVSGGINDGLNYGFTLIPTIDNSVEEVEGSPYLDENFSRGVVHIEGKEPLEVYLRYNVVEERMEIKTNIQSPRIYQLPAGNRAVYELGNKTFLLDKISSEGKTVYGYFIKLFDGKNYRLLKKPVAHYTEGEKASTGYGKNKPGRITIKEEYFVIPNSGGAVHVRPKSKDIKNAFGEEAKEYLKNNEVKSELDLQNFVAFLDKN
ncbi:hypothetical protein HC174_13290 [Salinimicrobium sp. CDJ15-81-2]|nr:hypothetical protein [Salinimicrobium nanhaiense]